MTLLSSRGDEGQRGVVCCDGDVDDDGGVVCLVVLRACFTYGMSM